MANETTNQGRGELTERVEEASRVQLGYEITQKELRFMAYVQYELMNNQKLDVNKIDGAEIVIFDSWVKDGRAYFVGDYFRVTSAFWQAMNNILWLSYVDRS
jgi:hypothetical protein